MFSAGIQLRTHVCTHTATDKQFKNIMPPPPILWVAGGTKISEQMDHTMQDGRVVGEERLVLDTNEVVIVTSLPDTSSHERDVIPAPPVVTSQHRRIRSIRISSDKPKTRHENECQ